MTLTTPNRHSGESRNLVVTLVLADSGFRRNDGAKRYYVR